MDVSTSEAGNMTDLLDRAASHGRPSVAKKFDHCMKEGTASAVESRQQSKQVVRLNYDYDMIIWVVTHRDGRKTLLDEALSAALQHLAKFVCFLMFTFQQDIPAVGIEVQQSKDLLKIIKPKI